MITSYYCSSTSPVNSIAEQSKTGAATNIIAGLAVGMSPPPSRSSSSRGGILVAYHFAGLYGVAIAALGMLSTTGIQLAVDAYGPIADNAGGIAEMSHQPPRSASAPTSSTPSATPPPPSARASPSARPP
jgi:K(+)-stimulated pyrophosphate-energized sodium pump